MEEEKVLSVNIPAGVDNGDRIRLSGEGEAGLRGAPAGDLYVDVGVKSHPIFQRDGANIFVRVPLRMTQAALGGGVEVPTIDGGRARVAIPAGTQAGDQFRLRGKGFSVLRSAARVTGSDVGDARVIAAPAWCVPASRSRATDVGPRT